MGDVWSEVMLVVLACMVSCCHATVPKYLIPENIDSLGIGALSICKADLGTNSWLAMPRTSDQASAFIKLLTQRNVGNPVWIGLYRKPNSDQFYWINNDTEPLGLKPLLPIEWYPGQPDNTGGYDNCVVARPRWPAGLSGPIVWELDDMECLDYRRFVCQMPDDSPPSMSVTADEVDDGDQVNLTCNWNQLVSVHETLLYTYWKAGSADILDKQLEGPSAASDTHSLTSVNVSDTGRYWCTVGAHLGDSPVYETLSTSNSINLRVIPKTPTFSLDPPVPVTGVYDGTQVTFLCVSDSATRVKIVPTFHFLRDGIIIKSTNLTYTKKMTTSDIGNYSCKVTMNGVDSALSNIIAVEASTTTNEPNTTDESTTTATPATTKKPGLSPEMKVAVGIQLAGFVAGLFGLLGMCVPMVYVCLRNACCKGDMEDKEGDDDNDEEDEDEKYLNKDDERVRKVRWESEDEASERRESTVSSIVSHAEKAVNAVWSSMSGGMVSGGLMPGGLMPGGLMPGGLMPGGVHGVMKRGSGVDLTSIDEGKSPDTTLTTSTSESPRGSVVSRLFGSDLFVPRLSGSAISPSEVIRKQ